MAQRDTVVKKEFDGMETMDLSTNGKFEVSESTGKGGQVITSAMITVRKADGSGTEVIRLDDKTAIMAYGRVQALTSIEAKAGIALCYEFHVVRDTKLFSQFGMNSFSEWVERVTGMSPKTGDIYARVGANFVDCKEVDGKAQYSLKHGLNDYSSFLTVGHLIEMLKFVPAKEKLSDEIDIPSQILSSGYSMYLSTKDLREAIKKIQSGENAIDVKSEEITEQTTGQEQSQEQEKEKTQEQEKEKTQEENAKTEKEIALNNFTNAKAALQSAAQDIEKYADKETVKLIRKLMVELANINF